MGHLKFIDYFQFTPKGLGVLTKTLVDDEFMYLRESCTILISSDAKVSIPMTIWIALTDLTKLPSQDAFLASCLAFLVRTRSMHMQLECGLPLDVGQ